MLIPGTGETGLTTGSWRSEGGSCGTGDWSSHGEVHGDGSGTEAEGKRGKKTSQLRHFLCLVVLYTSYKCARFWLVDRWRARSSIRGVKVTVVARIGHLRTLKFQELEEATVTSASRRVTMLWRKTTTFGDLTRYCDVIRWNWNVLILNMVLYSCFSLSTVRNTATFSVTAWWLMSDLSIPSYDVQET